MNRVWQILYPVLVYLFIYEGAFMVFRMLLDEDRFSYIFCLMLSGIITIIPLFIIYRKLPIIRMKPLFSKEDKKIIPFILLTVLIGIGINIIVSYLPLFEISQSYEEANKALLSDKLFILILSNVIIIPFLEELLYRGIILSQLNFWINEYAAVLISALFFGIFHFNIIQFLYAFIMGFFLGLIYIRQKKLWGSYLAHLLINLFVVLMTGGT